MKKSTIGIFVFLLVCGGLNGIGRLVFDGDTREKCQLFFGNDYRDISNSYSDQMTCSNGEDTKVIVRTERN